MAEIEQSDSRAERLIRFRQMAGEARQSAAQAVTAELRQGYQQLAAAWEQIIHEIERRE